MRGKFEFLEDRRLLATYALAETIDNPARNHNDYFSGHAQLSGEQFITGALAVDEGTVVVGAYRDDTKALDAGSVYVYDGPGTPITLTNPESPISSTGGQQRPWTADGDLFGWDVDIFDRTVFASSRQDDVEVVNGSIISTYDNAGSVRTYDLDTGVWKEFEHPDPWPQGQFGKRIAVTNEVLIVSADSHDGDLDNDGLFDSNGSSSGIVYALDPLNGDLIYEEKFNNPGLHAPSFNDYFGWGLDVDGDWVIIGAPGVDLDINNPVANEGEAYLWNWKTGSYKTISNPDPDDDDAFGTDVAIHGNHFVVTAPGDDNSGTNSGRAYLYQFDSNGNIVNSKVISNPDQAPLNSTFGGAAGDWFGASVDISGDSIVIGTEFSINASPRGANAYVFTNVPGNFSSSGVLESTLTVDRSDATNLDYGHSIAIDDSNPLIAVGAPGANVSGSINAGMVFIFAPDTPIKYDVNTQLDLPDLNPGNGIVDTGQFVAGQPAVSLRAAIQEANALWGHPPVTICLPEGHYILDRVGTESTNALYNDLDILGNITIEGNGAGVSIIDASGISDRVFQVTDSGSLTVSAVTLTGGTANSTEGGAVWVDGGVLSLDEVAVVNNVARYGGGIRIEDNSDVTIRNSVLARNTANLNGGGIDASSKQDVSLKISGTIFGNNISTGPGGGFTPNVNFSNTVFTSDSGSLGNNLLDSFSGHEYAGAGNQFFSTAFDTLKFGQPKMVVTSTNDEFDFTNNIYDFSLRETIATANANIVGGQIIGGEIWLPAWTHNLTRTGTESGLAIVHDLDINSPIEIIGAGPGLSNIDASAITDRIFQVSSFGDLTISRATLTGGNATQSQSVYPVGGALWVTQGGTLLLDQVSVVGNTAGYGGGLRLESFASATITNSLFASNTAEFFGGAIEAVGSQNVSLTIGDSVFGNNISVNGVTPNIDFTNAQFNVGSGTLGNNLLDSLTGHTYSIGSGTADFFNTSVDTLRFGQPKFIVTSVEDKLDSTDGVSSFTLRDAVVASNNDPIDEVWLAPWLYLLIQENEVNDEDLGVTGDLDILDDLDIIAEDNATIDASLIADSVFEQIGAAALSLNNVNVVN